MLVYGNQSNKHFLNVIKLLGLKFIEALVEEVSASVMAPYISATWGLFMKILKVSFISFWEKSASSATVEIALENMLVSGAGVRVAPTLWIAVVKALSADPTVFLTSEKA
jgi:hypothetical protein